MKTLKSQIKKALTCDSKCGHTLKDTNACFEHQVERVKDLIEIEAGSRPFAIQPIGWRLGQTIFNFLRWLRLKGLSASYQGSILADTFNLTDNEFEKYYAKFLKEHII